MNNELLLLKEIKSGFNWPVDLLRYGIHGTARYLHGEQYSGQLPEEVVEKVRFSLRKVKIAAKDLRQIAAISWVQMIFITGSVASLNANEADDIDVWLIVDPKRIWLTRMLDFFLFVAKGKRRLSTDGVESEKVKDKYCFNFYTTTEALELPQKNISSAMQFIDAIPVFIRDWSLYEELLRQNAWVGEIFPSWYKVATSFEYRTPLDALNPPKNGFNPLLDCMEYITGFLMLLKAEKRFYFAPATIFRKMFTTWGTTRILSRYDQETLTKSS